MQIGCPNCKIPLSLPPALLQQGVARISCARCAFAFVARLGNPAPSEKTNQAPALPIYLEGVKSSSAQSETAGEIGSSRPSFIPADTKTTIVIDPDLTRDVALHRANTGQTSTGPAAAHWMTASTDQVEVEVEPTAPGLMDLRTAPMSDDVDAAIAQQSTEGAPIPPVDTAPQADPPANRPESAEFECYAPVNSPVRAPQRPFPSAPPATAAPRLPPLGAVDSTVRHDFATSFPLQPPVHSRAVRVFGLMVSVVVFASIVLALFVLYRNDWSFDLSNFDKMLARAFGEDRQTLPPEVDQLQVSIPITELTRLKDGVPVLTAEGVVKNVGTRTRRFIYLRASIKRNNHIIAASEAPAGNLFRRSELAEMTKRRLNAALNPAGRQGRNARVDPGESVAYMVVITGLPEGFELSEHKVVAEVSQAELTETADE